MEIHLELSGPTNIKLQIENQLPRNFTQLRSYTKHTKVAAFTVRFFFDDITASFRSERSLSYWDVDQYHSFLLKPKVNSRK